MVVQIQLRRGLAADWTSADTLLAEGEIGLETDTGYFKFGDGSTSWTGLPYAYSGTGLVTEDIPFAWAPIESGGAVAITTGTRRQYNRTGRTLTLRYAVGSAGTAPVGDDIIFDLNINGTTVWSTQANRCKVVDGANEGHQTSFNTTTIADGQYFTLDVDNVGDPGTEGSGTSFIIWTRG